MNTIVYYRLFHKITFDVCEAVQDEGQNAINKCTKKQRRDALDALHAAVEPYTISMLEDTNLLAVCA